MKTVVLFVASACLIAFSTLKDDKGVNGSWQVVKAQYGNEPMHDIKELMIIKSFTGTRWSAAYYNKSTGAFDGAGGGTYRLTGKKYFETLEYFSWDSTAIGKTFEFSLTIENGMLHQTGVIEYLDNKNYVVDEWYKRID